MYQATYSENCAANMVAAPSSGGVAITTTDLLGTRGRLPVCFLHSKRGAVLKLIAHQHLGVQVRLLQQ